jgi:hypothetical protein
MPTRKRLRRRVAASRSPTREVASPDQVGQNLRRIARSLEAAPDVAVRAAGTLIVADADARGGSFDHGRTKLSARIIPKGKGSVTVAGTPAGAWAIKSFGRKTSVARGRALGSAGGNFHAKRSAPARGDRRWEKVEQTARESAPKAATKAVHEAVT